MQYTTLGTTGMKVSVAGLGCGGNSKIGLNAGYTTAQSVFTGWQNSPGHNANMLGTNYTTIGIGRHYVAGSPYGWYWTTEFGGFDDGWATAGPEVLTPVGSIQPLDSPSGPPTTAVSPVSMAPLAAIPSGAGGSAPSHGLDFGPTCAALEARKHPLAKLFCRRG